MRIIDLSKPLVDGDNIVCRVPDKLPIYEGRPCVEYRFDFRSHAGCYYETSAHVFRDGRMNNEGPVEQFFLPAVVSRLADDVRGEMSPEDLEHGLCGEIRAGDALLVDAGGRSDVWFSRSCAHWLADKGAMLLGANLGGYDTGFVNPTGIFTDLFKAEIPIIAGIRNLEEIADSRFFLIALPVLIETVCVGPCRVMAIEGTADEVNWLSSHLRCDLA